MGSGVAQHCHSPQQTPFPSGILNKAVRNSTTPPIHVFGSHTKLPATASHHSLHTHDGLLFQQYSRHLRCLYAVSYALPWSDDPKPPLDPSDFLKNSESRSRSLRDDDVARKGQTTTRDLNKRRFPWAGEDFTLYWWGWTNPTAPRWVAQANWTSCNESAQRKRFIGRGRWVNRSTGRLTIQFFHENAWGLSTLLVLSRLSFLLEGQPFLMGRNALSTYWFLGAEE